MLMLTPLALALILVETTDLIFRGGLNPGVLRHHRGSLSVFTSNMFAILGLRSLYFALADMIDMFRFLKVSLAIVLAIVGLKMLLAEPLKAALGPAFNVCLLLVVLVVLAFGVMASLWTGPAIEREELVEKDTSEIEEPPGA